MAFVFPADKSDFLAANGITYSWDGDKWRVRTFEGSGGAAVTVAMVPPEDPDIGDLFYDQTPGTDLLSVWDGTAWLPINEAPVIRASTVPQAPREGELWFNELSAFAFNLIEPVVCGSAADLADEIARLGLIEDNDGDIEDLQEEQAAEWPA